MNIENIKADIELLRKITDDWNHDIPEMEKEIVLSLLRRLYTDIKYADAAPCHAVPEQQGNVIRQDEAPAKPQVQTESAPQQDVTVPVAESTPAADVPATEKEPAAAPEQQEAAVQHEETPEEPKAQTAEPEPQQTSSAPDAHKNEPQQQKAEPAIKRPVNRNLIRTLYSDSTEMPEKQQPADQDAEQPAPSAPRAQTKVLGDVISQGPTLSDTLQMNSGMDMAEKIASADTKTLRGAIGLNDRFLMIRDLFGGNAGSFDTALSELERFDNLEEALLYINDNFDWDPECEGARMLVELLVRKLS